MQAQLRKATSTEEDSAVIPANKGQRTLFPSCQCSPFEQRRHIFPPVFCPEETVPIFF